MKTIKILLTILIILLLGIMVPIGITAYKANQFKKEVVKYKDKAEKAKDALGEAVVQTQKVITTLALVSAELAECNGVDQDSINNISYLKKLVLKKWAKSTSDE